MRPSDQSPPRHVEHITVKLFEEVTGRQWLTTPKSTRTYYRRLARIALAVTFDARTVMHRHEQEQPWS